MFDKKYIVGIDPCDSGVSGSNFSIMFHDRFGNLINPKGINYLNSAGMKEFDAAVKRIAAASNIKTIDDLIEEEDGR